MTKQTKKRTLGNGLSAKCVVSPALKCKTAKNFDLKKRVSKVVQEPDSPILKEIFDREIFTSSLINLVFSNSFVCLTIAPSSWGIVSYCNFDAAA